MDNSRVVPFELEKSITQANREQRSSTTPSSFEQNLYGSISQMDEKASPERNGYQDSEGSRTPTGSQIQVDDKEETSTLRSKHLPTKSTDYSQTSHAARDPTVSKQISSIHPSNSNTASTPAQSTYAPSTLNSYTPSSIVEKTSLLPHERHRHVLEQPQVQKTMGRKAFVRFCDAVNLLIPLDVNEEATSMHESSLGRMAQAVQEKRRSIGMVHRGDEAST